MFTGYSKGRDYENIISKAAAQAVVDSCIRCSRQLKCPVRFEHVAPAAAAAAEYLAVTQIHKKLYL